MAMAAAKSLAPVLILTVFCCHAFLTPSHASSDDFPQCLSASIPCPLVHAQSSPSFTSVLVSSIRNARFSTPTTVRPLWVITPTNASHVQAAVVCGRRHGVRLRVRSGGHDYEGLSYSAKRPEVFAVVDLSNLRGVRIDKQNSTAWVDSGATLGELYYAVRLVPVPPTVTAFRIPVTVDDGAVDAVTRWQEVAPALPDDLFIRAYFNYRDLDLGENVVVGNVSSYDAGKVWGEKYFRDNYKRLAMAKGEIDPDDYFRNEQSIPPLGPGK
ncbi:inactive tetrahydrocannabinolic acid synthase-like [Panicum miliaceum]|uniref:Inactive tetrahydrocannabinolic acid synthase-like n=1 Tax=Panicum miliaceum TaxID=4540 RepID=A0A3L6RYL0_PANMI|nr:inactive tetrahydrocannabinolic acid synthase-like [Panicum miliaceum]